MAMNVLYDFCLIRYIALTTVRLDNLWLFI